MYADRSCLLLIKPVDKFSIFDLYSRIVRIILTSAFLIIFDATGPIEAIHFLLANNQDSRILSYELESLLYCKSRKENPQKLTQLSHRSHPRHNVCPEFTYPCLSRP